MKHHAHFVCSLLQGLFDYRNPQQAATLSSEDVEMAGVDPGVAGYGQPSYMAAYPTNNTSAAGYPGSAAAEPCAPQATYQPIHSPDFEPAYQEYGITAYPSSQTVRVGPSSMNRVPPRAWPPNVGISGTLDSQQVRNP